MLVREQPLDVGMTLFQKLIDSLKLLMILVDEVHIGWVFHQISVKLQISVDWFPQPWLH